jgi:hypothetical protein
MARKDSLARRQRGSLLEALAVMVEPLGARRPTLEKRTLLQNAPYRCISFCFFI